MKKNIRLMKKIIRLHGFMMMLWGVVYGSVAIYLVSMDVLNPLTLDSPALNILKYFLYPISIPLAILYDIFANDSLRIPIMIWSYIALTLFIYSLGQIFRLVEPSNPISTRVLIKLNIIFLLGVFFFNKPYDKCISYYDDWFGQAICQGILLTEK